ncbi:MAG: molybdopterin oxidoreductase [Desulfobacteraceae bacterium]|nr:MAG: molybdopterin oxidoreductase [Desulfobacteraceae bacterium]
MKVDRRSFLGLGLGAAAGVALSPVGAKLTDDSSIWTQTWFLTPVPEDGEITFEPSVCSLCPGKCGINVRKITNRPVKVDGLEGYPVNDGGICLHGISAIQYLYDPSRVKTPMKRNGDTFESISWETAISEIKQKLGDIRKSGSASKLACVSGDDKGSVAQLFQRFLSAFGSNNFYTMPNLESALALTAQTMHGEDATIAYDLENAGMILSFGAGLIEGWGSPVSCFKANASKKDRGSKLYQIEARLSNTAANADKWIPVKPGTEADLALGICAVILKEKMFNAEYAQYFGGNFNKFAAMVQNKYSVANVSQTTGVPEAEIAKLANLFVKFNKSKSVAICGRGKANDAVSLKEFAAVHALNCLVGNINQKGGAWILPQNEYLQFPDVVTDDAADKGLSAKQISTSATGFFSKIKATSKPDIEALFVVNANPCHNLHDAKYITDVVKQVPFVVSFSSFMDETAKQADLILPSHTCLEMMQDLPSGSGVTRQVVGLSKPVVDPVFDTKNPGDAIIELAKSFEGSIAESFPWDDLEGCLSEVASDIWDTLSEDGHVVVSDKAPGSLPSVDFSFLAENPATAALAGDNNEYPLILIPIDNMRVAPGAQASSAFAVKTVADTVIKGKDGFIEINPATAKNMGIKDGSEVKVTTPSGSVVVRATYFHGIMPGYIGMVQGLGHDMNNMYVADKGVNVNELITPVFETGSGLDAAFGSVAKISKA